MKKYESYCGILLICSVSVGNSNTANTADLPPPHHFSAGGTIFTYKIN